MRRYLIFLLFVAGISGISAQTVIRIDRGSSGLEFEGIGAVSAGASSRLLIDYPEPYRSDILDFLFKPHFGASLQHFKFELGGDINSTCGTEPSHARTRQEMQNPVRFYFERGYEWWLAREALKRNRNMIFDILQWGAPGWFDGGFYSMDNAEYLASYIKGMKRYHNIDIAYCGLWNEKHIPDLSRNYSVNILIKRWPVLCRKHTPVGLSGGCCHGYSSISASFFTLNSWFCRLSFIIFRICVTNGSSIFMAMSFSS